jgi:hypothetical protein
MHKGAMAVCAILYAFAGCTTVTNQFRVVDAVDGHPIAGVHADGTWEMWQPSTVFPLWALCRFPCHPAESDATGLIVLDQPASEVKFMKRGYELRCVVASCLGYREKSGTCNSRSFPWEDKHTVTIRLQQRKGR